MRAFITGTVMLVATGAVAQEMRTPQVFAGCVPMDRLGFAIKMDDGSGRAADVALLGMLTSAGLLLPSEIAQLKDRLSPLIIDAHRREIGTIKWLG
jgi:L-asparaginase II